MKKNAIVRNKTLDCKIYLRSAIKLLTEALNRLSDVEPVDDTNPSETESTVETTADANQSEAEVSTDTYVKWPDARDEKEQQWIPKLDGWLSRRDWY